MRAARLQAAVDLSEKGADMVDAAAQPRLDPARPPDVDGASEPWIGRSLRRVEDERLVTGAGCFVDDIAPEDCLHLEFVRSPYAGGVIEALDVEAARSAPGVVAVFSGADVAALGHASVNPLVDGLKAPFFPILPVAEIGATGQPVAAVVADTLANARDATQLVELALKTRAPRSPSDATQAFGRQWRTGAVEAAFDAADAVVEATIRHARLSPSALEPRAALATPDETGGLTVYLPTQTPHRARADLARILRIGRESIRVVAPDVGGAFGGKASIYPEDVLVAFAALTLRRPVKWCATRSDEFLSATHGRGGCLKGALALARDGRFLALKAEVAFPLGHWMPFSGAVPARNAARILPGPYRVPAVAIAMRGDVTDTAPLGIYRGAGRPEAAMLMERLADEAARVLGRDPADLRRRNLLSPGELPARTPTGETLDAGDYPGLLREACRLGGYDALCADLARRRAAGEVCGVGLAIYVEPCGQGGESAALRLAPDGTIVAATGSTAQGQGRETAFAQIVADALGVTPGRVIVRHGDTAASPDGVGALASRSTAIGGSALLKAAEAFRDKARALAARILQIPLHCIASDADGFFVQGSPLGPRLTWSALAGAADADDLAVSLRFETPGEAWAAGCCLAAVAIDPETGELRIERLVYVDDAGMVVNPMLVEGQLIGGLAQGLGEALMERIVYDESGQLVTGSFMDYQLPRAADMPPVTLAKHPTPSVMNPLGAKGVGEAGCIGIPAAVVNAAVDALSPFGVRHLDMPLTSARIWRAMHNGASP
jgi:aerobic carbon-monoxide dehydrogenase large subunit